MAHPVDSARVATNISTAATSHNINVGSPVAGTLVIVFVRFAAAPGTVTFTGYTPIVTAETSDATDDSTYIFYRWADGAEGASDVLTTGNSVKLGAISWEITGAENPSRSAPTVSTVVVGTTTANTANGGSVAPASAPRDTLYLACCGGDGEAVAYTAAPTNYLNLQAANSGTGGAAASNVVMGGAGRGINNSSSEDPGAFTHGAHTTGWTGFTVAIRLPVPNTLERSAAVGATGAVVAAGTFFSVESRAAALGATAAIASSGEFESPVSDGPLGSAVLDDFNRADELLEDSANWAHIQNAHAEIVSNQAENSSTPPASGNYSWQTFFEADQEAWATIVAADASDEFGFRLRDHNQDLGDCYEGAIAGDGTVRLGRRDGGAFTLLDSTSVTFTPGDGFGVSMVGTTLKAWHRTSGTWAEVLSVVDSTHSTGGYLSIGFFSDADVLQWDDFGGDDFGANGAAAIGATAAVTVAGVFFSVESRAVALGASAGVAASGTFFSVFERSAAVAATATIASSGVVVPGVVTHERSASLSATAGIATSGLEVLSRSAALSATAAISSSGISIVSGAASLNATAAIASSATFFSIFSRSALVAATGSIATGRLVVALRSASLSATAAVTVSGEIAGAVTRSASFNATATIASAGVNATHSRSTAFSGLATISAAGTISVTLERAASLSAVATVAVAGVVQGPFVFSFPVGRAPVMTTAVGRAVIAGSTAGRILEPDDPLLEETNPIYPVP